MVNPCPGYSISTPYGKTGDWSCGWHTGADIAAPEGTQLVAAIAGQVRHRNYGDSFGNHQFAISPDPGQPFGDGEIFYAHTYDRLADGTYVNVGDHVAHVGNEGRSTGPHCHFEYHPHQKNSWGCNVVANPQPVIDHQGGGGAPSGGGTVYLSKLRYGQYDSDSVKHLQTVLNGHPLDGGQELPITGNYLDQTDEEVRLCQQQHGFGNDPVNQSYVGPSQAEHLFGGKGYTIVNDT